MTKIFKQTLKYLFNCLLVAGLFISAANAMYLPLGWSSVGYALIFVVCLVVLFSIWVAVAHHDGFIDGVKLQEMINQTNDEMNEIRIQKGALHSYFAMLEGLEEEIEFEDKKYKLYVERGNEQIPRYGITILLLDDFDIVGILYTFSEGVAKHRYLSVNEMKKLTYQI